MPITSRIVQCCVSFIAGVAAVLMFITIHAARVNTDWVDLTTSEGGVTYSTESLFKSDISLPMIKQFSGKAKFIMDNSTSDSMRLGYLIHVIVPPLNLNNVPEKYLKGRPVEDEGVRIVISPIEQVTYEIVFTFILKDSDGFTLVELFSTQHTVQSGKDNEYQDITLKAVPKMIAARTKAITMSIGVKKCLTCESK